MPTPRKKRPPGLSLAADLLAALHPAGDLGVATDETDVRFQPPTEIMLANAKKVLARNPGMTAQALLRWFAKDIRELNGDPCKEKFNPDSEIMKIKAQHELVQKLTALAEQAGGRRHSNSMRGVRGGAAPLRRRTRRKSKRGRVVKKRGSRRR